MTGRSPARLLAPAALVAAVVALFVVVTSSNGEKSADREPEPTPVATVEATAEPKDKADDEPSGETYVVEAGDTPSSIAAEQAVDLDALLEANPDIDPDGLSIGQELQLP